MKKKLFDQPLMHALLILILGILVYSNSLHVPFVFDDSFSIVDNPEIRNLPGLISDALSGHAYHPNRYVGFLTFALNYHFGGFEVTGYHLVNLLIHLANALLVYALLILTFRAPFLRNSVLQGAAGPVALLAGALFVVHPIQTQAVTYIVQRLTSLATTFYLSTFVLYAYARLNAGENRFFSAKGWVFYLASVATAILAMRTKEIAFTLPLLLSLYEFLFFEGSLRKRSSAIAPHLLTMLIIPLSILHLGRSAGEIIGELRQATEFQPTVSRYVYLVTQFRVVVTYLRLLVLPVHQNLDYDYPIYTSFFTPPVFVSFLLLAALFLLAIYLHRVSSPISDGSSSSLLSYRPSRAADPAVRLISFGIFWFFIALSVESSFIPITDVIFEHRVYLPSVGAFAGVAVAFVMLTVKARRRGLAWVLTVIAAAAVLSLAVGTWKRNEVWKTEETLWRDVVEKSPRNARAYSNLGAVLGEAGRTEEAIAALSTAIRLQPNNTKAQVNLGTALASAGRREEAIRILSEAVRIEPDNANALNNLGTVLTDAGRLDEAITILNQAVRYRPENARAHYNLGRAYLAAGRKVEGVAALETAVRLKSDYDDARVTLASALTRGGRFREAAILLERSMGRLAGRADARYVLGIASHCAGDSVTASRELAALQRLDTRSARQLESFLSRPCGGGQ
jgi:tetratricopeptide (TPR) repeat protein